jgi:hypothetical protein
MSVKRRKKPPRPKQRLGDTFHGQPSYDRDLEVVAVQVIDARTMMRLVYCQGNYLAEKHDEDLMGHPRWSPAESHEVAEWLRRVLEAHRGDDE